MVKTVSEDRRELLQYMMARDSNFYYECFHCIQLPAAIVALCTNDTNSQLSDFSYRLTC